MKPKNYIDDSDIAKWGKESSENLAQKVAQISNPTTYKAEPDKIIVERLVQVVDNSQVSFNIGVFVTGFGLGMALTALLYMAL